MQTPLSPRTAAASPPAPRDLVVLSAHNRQVFVQALLTPPSRTKGRLAQAVRRYRRAAR